MATVLCGASFSRFDYFAGSDIRNRSSIGELYRSCRKLDGVLQSARAWRNPSLLSSLWPRNVGCEWKMCLYCKILVKRRQNRQTDTLLHFSCIYLWLMPNYCETNQYTCMQVNICLYFFTVLYTHLCKAIYVCTNYSYMSIGTAVYPSSLGVFSFGKHLLMQQIFVDIYNCGGSSASSLSPFRLFTPGVRGYRSVGHGLHVYLEWDTRY